MRRKKFKIYSVCVDFVDALIITWISVQNLRILCIIFHLNGNIFVCFFQAFHSHLYLCTTSRYVGDIEVKFLVYLFKYEVGRRVSLVSADDNKNNNNNRMHMWTMHMHSRALHAVVDLDICFYLHQCVDASFVVLCIQMVCLGRREEKTFFLFKKKKKKRNLINIPGSFSVDSTITFYLSRRINLNVFYSVGLVEGVFHLTIFTHTHAHAYALKSFLWLFKLVHEVGARRRWKWSNKGEESKNWLRKMIAHQVDWAFSIFHCAWFQSGTKWTLSGSIWDQINYFEFDCISEWIYFVIYFRLSFSESVIML